MTRLTPFAVATLGAVAHSQCELAELLPATTPARFGVSAAIEGSVAVVGAEDEAVVFERRPQGWMEAATLTSPAPFSGDVRVALDGDRIVLGDPWGSDFAAGAMFVFERVAGQWTLRDDLDYLVFPSDSFGWDVEIDGDFVAGGALSPAALVWFFELQPGSGFTAEILDVDDFAFGGIDRWFGAAVAIDQEWYFVSDPKAGPPGPDELGHVFAYRRVAGAWVADQHFTASDAVDNLWFGADLALDAGRLYVASGSLVLPQRVYVLELQGGLWTETAVLTIPEDDGPGPALSEGPHVSAAGDRVLVDTITYGDQEGAGWLFELTSGTWGLTSKFAPATSPDQRVVRAHGLSDTGVVVTSDGPGLQPGKAWVFDVTSGRSYNFCQATPNSSGAPCRITHEGSTSVSRNDFNLAAESAPPGQPGIFFYGTAQTAVPFGNGFRCVDGAVFRLNPPQDVDANGRAERVVDFTRPPAGGGPGEIPPGSTRYFQFWYRDPAGGGSAFDLSDGYAIEFCP